MVWAFFQARHRLGQCGGFAHLLVSVLYRRFVLAISALSLGQGAMVGHPLSMVLPGAHMYGNAAQRTANRRPDINWVTWVSFFAVVGAPTSLWVWAVMVELMSPATKAELAITNERLRFAADLHDVQGHHLQVISLKTDLASRLLAKDRLTLPLPTSSRPTTPPAQPCERPAPGSGIPKDHSRSGA